MPTAGVHIDRFGKKKFIPLENNPEVFTSLVHHLGLSDELGFYDVYNLEEPELLALIPRPVYALILITPPGPYDAVRAADKTPLAANGVTYNKNGDDESVMWFLQTIGNACGLMALIHSIANGEARSFVKSGSLMDTILEQARPLGVQARADVLYNSKELEEIHMNAARGGDSHAPHAEDKVELHFIAFTKGKDGHLYELEGGVDGPIDRGEMAAGEDMLSDRSLENTVKRFIRVSGGNLNFSIVALAKRD
ncbi:hypothetical protein ACHAPJ_012672 [Fusarium lateritium]